MIDLLTNLPALLGGLVALIAAFLGYGAWNRRKGGQEREQDASEADDAEAKRIRQNVRKADFATGIADALDGVRDFDRATDPKRNGR